MAPPGVPETAQCKQAMVSGAKRRDARDREAKRERETKRPRDRVWAEDGSNRGGIERAGLGFAKEGLVHVGVAWRRPTLGGGGRGSK